MKYWELRKSEKPPTSDGVSQIFKASFCSPLFTILEWNTLLEAILLSVGPLPLFALSPAGLGNFNMGLLLQSYLLFLSQPPWPERIICYCEG